MIAPRILIGRSRRENSLLLEIGGYFRGSKGWDAGGFQKPIFELRGV